MTDWLQDDSWQTMTNYDKLLTNSWCFRFDPLSWIWKNDSRDSRIMPEWCSEPLVPFPQTCVAPAPKANRHSVHRRWCGCQICCFLSKKPWESVLNMISPVWPKAPECWLEPILTFFYLHNISTPSYTIYIVYSMISYFIILY